MFKRLLPIILFIIVVDVIAIQAFETIFGASVLLQSLFFGASAIVISTLLLYFSSDLRKRIPIPRQLLMGIFFMLLFPKFIIALLLLGEDVFRMLGWAANGLLSLFGTEAFFHTGRSVLWSWIAIGFSGFLGLAFIYGSLFNVYRYKVRNVKVKLLSLPKAFNGLKVVQISDIHSGSLKDKDAVLQAVKTINALEPDLIFFTGDLVNNIADEAQGFVSIFSQLKARHGVYSILGNHDYGDYMVWPDAETKDANLEQLKSTHARMGWRLLLNEHVHIERDGESIVVAGVENWSARGRFKSYGKLQQALHGVQDALTVLLLSHDPSHWEAEILDHPARVDITFSGHTHGMQFGFEWLRLRWSPVQYVYRQWAGLYHRQNQYLYVNRGFGVIGYPGRVGILPEITLFTLQSVQDH